MIKFAGVNTLIPTPEVEEFISRFLNEEYMRFWYEPGHGPDVGASAPVVPRLNWKRTFQPRLNQLIWPTGASRWASMLLLVDSAMLDTIMPIVNTAASTVHIAAGAQLVIADSGFVSEPEDDTFTREVITPAEGETPATYGNRVALSTEMFALEARPVSLPYSWNGSAWIETTEKTLWLLPLVDKRWFGQWLDIGSPEDPWDDWDQAITLAGSGVGTLTVNEVHEDYDIFPNVVQSSVVYGNKMLLADAFCHNVGQRFVRRIDGTATTMRHTDAATTWGNNFEGDGDDAYSVWQVIAGADYSDKHKASATIPAQFNVVFPEGGQVTVNADDVGATQWRTGATLTWHVMADADADETTFAERAVTDYLGWLAKKADITFAGVKAWRLTGFEDVVIWSSSLTMGLTTRVVTHPENIGLLPVGGSGQSPVSSTFVRIYTLAIRGTASAGTIDWEAEKTVIVEGEPTTVTETGTWDFDSGEADIQTSLEVVDPDVLVIGGDIRWNVCKIRWADPTARLRITATDLTREEHGITPQAELSWCAENENAWWE